MARNYYAASFPDGTNANAPTYPVEIVVHCFDLDLVRHDAAEKAKVDALHGTTWRRVGHSHTIARVARKLVAEGAQWPITMTLEGPHKISLEQAPA